MESDAGRTHRNNEPDPEVWDRGYDTPHKQLYATMPQLIFHALHPQVGPVVSEVFLKPPVLHCPHTA